MRELHVAFARIRLPPSLVASTRYAVAVGDDRRPVPDRPGRTRATHRHARSAVPTRVRSAASRRRRKYDQAGTSVWLISRSNCANQGQRPVRCSARPRQCQHVGDGLRADQALPQDHGSDRWGRRSSGSLRPGRPASGGRRRRSPSWCHASRLWWRGDRILALGQYVGDLARSSSIATGCSGVNITVPARPPSPTAEVGARCSRPDAQPERFMDRLRALYVTR